MKLKHLTVCMISNTALGLSSLVYAHAQAGTFAPLSTVVTTSGIPTPIRHNAPSNMALTDTPRKIITPNQDSVNTNYMATPFAWGPTGVTGATSFIDGQSNTSILATEPPTPPSDYPAAQACADKDVDTFDDWYLPARCEMSNGGSSSACNTTGVPTLQNMTSNLADNDIGQLEPFGQYWSSTEYNNLYAWQINFDGGEGENGKNAQRNVRCVRKF